MLNLNPQTDHMVKNCPRQFMIPKPTKFQLPIVGTCEVVLLILLGVVPFPSSGPLSLGLARMAVPKFVAKVAGAAILAS
jgi:hypothetical protein